MAEEVTYAEIQFTNIRGQKCSTTPSTPAKPRTPHTQASNRGRLHIALAVSLFIFLLAMAVMGIVLGTQISSAWERRLEEKEKELEEKEKELENLRQEVSELRNESAMCSNASEIYKNEAMKYMNLTKRYVKQMESAGVDPSTGRRKQQCCPEGWKGGDCGRCYYVSTDQRSWASANQTCSSVGAQLLVIDDKREMEVLKRLVSNYYSYWIGLSWNSSRGAWRWVNGSDLNKEVVTAGTGYYGYCGYWSWGSSTVYSRDCRETHPWICEGDPVTVWPPPSLS
ncbi:killer cell lectin-like receptor subfamily B member 1 [Lepisosteus oculatus]|uniref:killer cell lectin-like receptor subfamily B member 1 n=1 Tax=Lepisosteus oculatus TaxID=7918 RepID=UPI00371B6CA1